MGWWLAVLSVVWAPQQGMKYYGGQERPRFAECDRLIAATYTVVIQWLYSWYLKYSSK
jgi:hypothetical protein